MKRPVPSRILVLTLTFSALALLVLAGPASAKRRGGPAMQADGPTDSQLAVHQLRQQIAAEELLIALDLSREQRASLTALVTRMVEEREAKNAAREADTPKLEALLQDYLAEVRADGAASQATAEALKSFREARRPEPEELRERHEQVREELTGLLDPAQLEALRDFRPMRAAGPSEDERAERREARRERLEKKHHEMAEGLDADDMEEMQQMRRDKGERKNTRRILREVLFSRAMLDALAR